MANLDHLQFRYVFEAAQAKEHRFAQIPEDSRPPANFATSPGSCTERRCQEWQKIGNQREISKLKRPENLEL